ncbi:MAG TPA: DUF1801 domain-containing protein [Candidatus Limnocylindrales bacterium]|nr:DUF1801 domain-containing protein [Candidatus Limnocylindrales bacterium]
MATKPATVAEYLATAPEDRHAGIEDLRRTVTAAAPDAVECIAYDMPAYRLDGRFMVSFGAFKRHYSLFPASQVVLDTLGDEAAAYAKGKGTFQFPAKDPLPLDLIARIVRIRREETAAAGR